ncbi:MAG: GFA family protein [Burkholderiaceae bacterium]
MSENYRASCLCGTIRFEVSEIERRAGHCHCSMCRKFHGAEYATLATVPRRAITWQAGQDAVADYCAQNGTIRSFCRQCGSSLFFASPRADPATIEVALAVFDDDLPVVPDAHIFVHYAPNWSVISDDLPRFPEGRASAS